MKRSTMPGGKVYVTYIEGGSREEGKVLTVGNVFCKVEMKDGEVLSVPSDCLEPMYLSKEVASIILGIICFLGMIGIHSLCYNWG